MRTATIGSALALTIFVLGAEPCAAGRRLRSTRFFESPILQPTKPAAAFHDSVRFGRGIGSEQGQHLHERVQSYPTTFPQTMTFSAQPSIETDKRKGWCRHAMACGDRYHLGPSWDPASYVEDGATCFCHGRNPVTSQPTGACHRGRCMIGTEPEAGFADETSRQWSRDNDNLDAHGLCVYMEILDTEVDHSLCEHNPGPTDKEDVEYLALGEPPPKDYAGWMESAGLDDPKAKKDGKAKKGTKKKPVVSEMVQQMQALAAGAPPFVKPVTNKKTKKRILDPSAPINLQTLMDMWSLQGIIVKQSQEKEATKGAKEAKKADDKARKSALSSGRDPPRNTPDKDTMPPVFGAPR